MSDANAPQDPVVDVVFALQGHCLERDHAQAFRQALCARWSWLMTEAQAGIHPVKLVPGTEAQALLSGRARLLLRVPAHRVDELLSAQQQTFTLTVQDQALTLGTPHVRALQPHATLYAYRVAAPSEDEITFMARVEAELDDLGVAGQRVCGKHQCLRVTGPGAPGQVLHAFSLMLHGLLPAQSLLLQQRGLGPHRLLGCGIFVPHKSAAAVGAS